MRENFVYSMIYRMTSGKSIIQDGRNKTFDGQARTFTNTYSRTLTDTHTDTQTHVLAHKHLHKHKHPRTRMCLGSCIETRTLTRSLGSIHRSICTHAHICAQKSSAHAMTHPFTETFIDAQKRVLTNQPHTSTPDYTHLQALKRKRI